MNMKTRFVVALEGDAPDEVKDPAVELSPVEPSPEDTPAEPAAEVPAQEPAPEADNTPKTVIIPAHGDEPTTIITAEELEVIETTGDEVAEIIEQAQASVDESQAIDEDTEKVETAATALEAFSELIDKLKKRKTFDKTHVAAISLGVEAIYDNVGLLKPGMESMLVSKPSLDGGVSIGLEDIKQQAARLMEGVIAALKRAGEYLLNFFKTILSVKGRLKMRAESLLEVAKRLKGAPGEKLVGNAALAAVINSGRNNSPAQGLQDIVELIKASAQPLGQGSTGVMLTVQELMTAYQSGKEMSAEKTRAIEDRLAGELGATIGAPLKHHGAQAHAAAPQAPEDCELYTTDVLMGNKVVWAHIPTSATSLAHFQTGVADVEHDTREDAKLATLSPRDITAVATATIAFVKGLDVVEKANKQMEESMKALSKVAGMAYATHQVKQGEFSLKDVAVTARIISRLSKGVMQPAVAIGMRAFQASLDYAALSAKAYGKTSVSASAAAIAA